MRRQDDMGRCTADDWRMDITGPDTAVLTSVTGRRWMITFRPRRLRRRWTWTGLMTWLIPAVILGAAVFMGAVLVGLYLQGRWQL